MKELISKIPNELRHFFLFMTLLAFSAWFFIPHSPMSVEQTKKYNIQLIQQHCKKMNYDLCDYKLVKVIRDNSINGEGIYLYESKYRNPISVNADGDRINLLDNELYSLQANQHSK